ncbi:hypothetical protein HU200_016774 [Digitaria exilis]|uniref:Uncharacterized protein n=1 Tax=Digitaria exilis TaxID=1010633 RepID=A0A835KKQ3_9POAL|nr:hypothetical protein HU200_016774 [Digitaria exilis]CAB3491181.1 unnamed protein product [Digitaria exilis]
MAAATHRGQNPAAAVATASRRRSARLAALQRKFPAPPPPAATVAPVPQTRRQQRRQRRPFLPFRRSHDQSCLTSDVARHQVVFVHAWPGTGKSTQIPRVLHATGRHGRVLCSQTYRVAAESAAAHAASDMRASGEVHLRFDTNHGWGAWEYLSEPVITDYVAAAVDTVCRVHATEPPRDVLVFLPRRAEVEAAKCLLISHGLPGLVTHCLHDGIAIDLIGDVLSPTSGGERKVVLATDVADSAVFVEGINYIVDSGYRGTDNAPPSLTGSSPPQMIRALKAAVLSWYHIRRRDNRGKCFCPYTVEEWDEMVRGCSPLRSRTDDVDSLAGIVLVLKDLGIISRNVENFGFVLPPRHEMLQRAVAPLVAAGMVGVEGEVTEKGRRMASEILEKCYF